MKFDKIPCFCQTSVSNFVIGLITLDFNIWSYDPFTELRILQYLSFFFQFISNPIVLRTYLLASSHQSRVVYFQFTHNHFRSHSLLDLSTSQVGAGWPMSDLVWSTLKPWPMVLAFGLCLCRPFCKRACVAQWVITSWKPKGLERQIGLLYMLSMRKNHTILVSLNTCVQIGG